MRWPSRTEDSELPAGVGELGRGERGNSKLGEFGCCRLESKATGEWVILGAEAGPQGSPMISVQEGVLGCRGTIWAEKVVATRP